jgi:hypothetical protein
VAAEHFIYLLRDPRTGEARYVGHTVSPTNRLMGHMNGTLKCLRAWFEELSCIRLKPLLHVVQRDLNSLWNAQKAEYEWYLGLKEAGAPLLNTVRRPRPPKIHGLSSYIHGLVVRPRPQRFPAV